MERVAQHLERIKWNVRIEPPYRHGVGLVLYLARYVCGGPIGKGCIQGFDGTALNVVVGREATHPSTIRLSAEDFVQRLLEHVPVPRLRMLRSCGLYAATKRRQLELSRTVVAPTEEGAAASARRSDEACLPRCPQCGKRLEAHDPAPPRRRQPTFERTRAAPLAALVLTPLTAAA